MHRFTLIDSQILLGLAGADKGADITCPELIASCAAVGPSIPTREEFATAFNKFLYTSIINLDGDKIRFADFGREIIRKARGNANTGIESGQLKRLVLKELLGYKLKSMCNRNVWSQEQYEQAVNAQQNKFKP